MTSTGVQVVVRLRPLNEKEKKYGTLPVVSASTNDKTVTVIKGTGGRQARSQYSFDNVFTGFSTQEEVFQTTLKPVIKDVLRGFESTVFAYGQTGTGKTHTMEGSLDNQEDYGVIPRAAESIFEELNRVDLNYETFKVSCSYLEIYNEDLCDLLAETPDTTPSSGPRSPKRSATQKLEIMEGKNGPFCRGLSEREVKTADDLLGLMQKAQQSRKVGETNMNKQSSRSHCIFTLRVEARRRFADGALFETRGKLHMVDLAGSECAKTANLDDGGSQQAARERERMNINRSLLTLGRVVKLLKEQSTRGKPGNIRIPYRDSKLTRILQQALGGNSKTVIIGTLSPSVTAIEESISTLNYAQAAHGIINKPVSASYLSEATKSASLLSGMESSTYGAQSLEHWKEMEVRLEYMKCQVEEAKAALARKHLQQQEIVERTERAEAEKAVMEDQLVLIQKEADSVKAELKNAEEKLCATETELGESKMLLDKATLVLKATQRTEARLTKEALALIEALKQSVSDGDKLHCMLMANREADMKRRRAAKTFNDSVAAFLTVVKQTLNVLSVEGARVQRNYEFISSTAAGKETQFLDDTKEILRTAVTCVDDAVSTLKSSVHEKDGIVPTADALAKESLSRVGRAWSRLETSEQNLIGLFSSTCQVLSQFGTRLKELENSHAAAADETLSVLESSAAMAKQKMEDLVNSTAISLEQGRVARKEIRDATREVVEQWKRSMVESGNMLLQQSTTQLARVDECASKMASEMGRHVNIETQLSGQGSLLESSRAASIVRHEVQKELLLQTQTTLEAMHNNQTQLLSRFVQKLMKDVESLLQNQVAEVMKEVNGDHAVLMDKCSSLVSNHTDIASTTLETLRKAREFKSIIEQEAAAAKKNDEVLISHLGATRSVLADIQDCAGDHQTNASMFARNIVEKLKVLEDLENMDTLVYDKLRADGNNCVTFLSDSMLVDTVNHLSKQTESGTLLVKYTSCVLEAATSAVNEMEKPRHELMSSLSLDRSKLEECFEKGLTQIKVKASASSVIADDLREKIQAIKLKFENATVKDHGDEIAQTKAAFLECGAKHAGFTSLSIEHAQDVSSKVLHTTESFVNVDLSTFAEVPEAPERIKITYSSDLSTTASEREILGNLGRANRSSVLQALSPNQDILLTASKKRHGGYTVPSFPHERNEPRREHLR